MITITLKTADSMSIDLDFNKEQPPSEREGKIVRILERFTDLSPDKQETIMKFIDFLEVRNQ